MGSKDRGMNLFEKRRLRCDDFTMENAPQQETPDRVQEDMFQMRQNYANWADGKNVPVTGYKWVTAEQTEDETAREKMAQRYEEMERRGQMGQKLTDKQHHRSNDGQVFSFQSDTADAARRQSRGSNQSLDRRQSRGSNESLDRRHSRYSNDSLNTEGIREGVVNEADDRVDTDLLRSDEKSFTYR